MYCGIVLTNSPEEPSAVAFVDDDGVVTAESVAGNEDIVALLQEHRPTIVALNAPPERVTEQPEEFRAGEQELVDEGHRILPQGMRDRQVLERAAHLTRQVEGSGVGCRVIESDPHVVARMLDIATDDDLDDYGVVPADITSAREFDAVILAIVAKLADDRTDDRDIMVPAEPDEPF